jgi:hypothetical protein
MKRVLPTVTLLGIDCVNIERLILAAEICTEHFEFAAVKLLSSLPAPAHTSRVEIAHIGSEAEYSEFVIRHLAPHVDTPHVLIIQYDGFILNPSAWEDEFLEYDYIGAPWHIRASHIHRHGFPEEFLGTWRVGNGGFSLRSKRLLEECAHLAAQGVFVEYHPEDVQVCIHHRTALERKGVKYAPVELAKRFSYESDGTGRVWSGEFGFHGIRWTDISAWTAQHPEYQVDMKANTLTRREQV